MKSMRVLFVLVLLFLFPGTSPVQSAGSEVIYADGLGNGWNDWSWNSNNQFAAHAPVYSGANSVGVTFTGGWGGFSLANPGGVATSGYTSLRFFIHGGASGGQTLQVFVHVADGSPNGVDEAAVAVPVPSANQWKEMRLSLASLHAASAVITRINWQSTSNSAQSTFYMDEIAFIENLDPQGPQLSGGELSPRAIRAGSSDRAVLRVQVRDPQGAGDIASVRVDASALGAGTLTLRDDGTSGDDAAGDAVYGVSFSLPAAAAGKESLLTVTAQDAAGHTASFPVAVMVGLGDPGGSIPAALPQQLGWGTNAWTGNAQDWQVNSGSQWDYLYQYITYGWETWGDHFVSRFVQYAWQHHYVPVISVYIMLDTPSNCGEGNPCYANKLTNSDTVSTYLATFERALNEAKGAQPVIFHLEPDFYGFMQQYTNQATLPAGVRKDDPTSIAVALNRPGYPNTLAGFGKYLVDQIHAVAPNALAAPMASAWATNGSPHNVSAGEAVLMGQRTASFINAMGGAQADLLAIEWSDRDAGSGIRPWWDDTDLTLPRPTRALLWANALSRASGKRLLLWQVPAGNMALNDTPQHYRDNRAAYLFHHASELLQTGILGVAFGAGDGNQTQVWTDGGYLARQYAPPDAPTALTLIRLNDPLAALHWNPSHAPTTAGYQLQFHQAGGATYTRTLGKVTDNTIILPSPGTWLVEVRAIDGLGSLSAPSNPVTITTSLAADMVYLPVLANR